mmetsp:Transcript_13559/g.29824  ORF Transcript_13559/g.29824 Transcript_13559/m.29824 type:complete len:318 (-) Transcript_13559:300-1253(-)
MAARSTSIDFLGVSKVSMASCSTDFTVEDIDVKRSVRLPTREVRTESASLSDTSAATFLDIKEVLKDFKIGSRSSSESTAPPVMFFTLLVKFLKRPPIRPDLPSLAPAFPDSASSSSEPDDRDSTSSASFSSPEPKNSAFLASMSFVEGSSPFLEKSSSFMTVLLTLLAPSQCLASFFLDFSVPVSSSFASFLPPATFGRADGLPGESWEAPPPSSSSSSPPSASSLPSLPDFPFFLEGAVLGASFLFLSTSSPFFVSAKEAIFFGLFDSINSLSAFCRTFRKLESKSTCLSESPLPKASFTISRNSSAARVSSPSR